MRPRSAGRRLAFQYLFTADLQRFTQVESFDQFLRVQRESHRRETDETEEAGFSPDQPDLKQDEAEAFAFALVNAAMSRRHEIDEMIGKAAHNWTVARMAAVERNILRIAVAEMLLEQTPPKVVIDEAVELAKRFGDKDSGAFVNGVLDHVGEGGEGNAGGQ